MSRDGECEFEFIDRYKKALGFTAARGNPISQFALAELFEDSDDKSKAFKYYQLSSEKQFAPSMTNVGIKMVIW